MAIKSSNLKEYVLRIIIDSSTGEIQHLSESIDLGFSLDIDGETILLSEELSKFLENKLDSNILGLS